MAAGWGARLVVSDHVGVDGVDNRSIHLIFDFLADGTPKTPRPTTPQHVASRSYRARHRTRSDRFVEASIVDLARRSVCRKCLTKAEHREAIDGLR